jgi:hypothetical protein
VGGADQAATSEKQKKKNITQPPGKTMIELLLKYQQQDWMLEE